MQAKPEKLARLPLVTVVVTSYNHGAYLKICLDSIFEQTYENIQLIVVDNASADDSRTVITQFADHVKGSGASMTVEPMLSDENAHLTGAMLKGFAKARGSYVIFVDGDDCLLSHCVEAHIQAHLMTLIPVGATSIDMYQSRGADLVVGTGSTYGRFIMSGKGQTKSFCRMSNLDAFEFPPRSDGFRLQEKDLHFVDQSMIQQWVWSPTSGLCFRREAVQLMFNYRPKLGAGTDNYLIRAITALTGSITIDRSLGVYRLHETNMFTKHPALTNLVSFDKGALAESDDEVGREIIECFRTQATEFAALLEMADSYIEAIDAISRVGTRPGPPRFISTYAGRFLVDNRDLLIGAFGKHVYLGWILRYLRPLDWCNYWARKLRGPSVDAKAQPTAADRH